MPSHTWQAQDFIWRLKNHIEDRKFLNRNLEKLRRQHPECWIVIFRKEIHVFEKNEELALAFVKRRNYWPVIIYLHRAPRYRIVIK